MNAAVNVQEDQVFKEQNIHCSSHDYPLRQNVLEMNIIIQHPIDLFLLFLLDLYRVYFFCQTNIFLFFFSPFSGGVFFPYLH